MALRFAFPALSSEGGGFVLLRSSPVPARRVLAVKLAVVSLPSILLAAGLAGLTTRFLDVRPPVSTMTSLASIAMGIALPAFALGIGARFPRFDAADPSELAVSPAGIATMLASLVYIGIVVVLACPPLHRLLLTWRGHPEPARWEVPAAAAAIVAVSALFALAPLRAAERSLERGSD